MRKASEARLYALTTTTACLLALLAGVVGAPTRAVMQDLVFDQYQRWKPRPYAFDQPVRVVAVDDDEAALFALKRAAASTAGLKPVEVEARDLFRRPLAASELKGFDAVIFDPPRQGAEMQARELAASGVPLVIAVSCHPGTFARDVRSLTDRGYRLTAVTPVDQFRYAAHVEIVARLER